MALTPPDILILGRIKFNATNVIEYYSSPGSNYDGVNLTYNSQFEISPQISSYPDNTNNPNTFNANDIEVGFKYILPSGKMYDVVGVDVYDADSASIDLKDTDLRGYLNSTEEPPSNYPEDSNYGIFVPTVNGVVQLSNLTPNTNYFPSDTYWIADLLGDAITKISGSGNAFPYTGSAQITGSLKVVGNVGGTTLNNVLISTGSGTASHNFAVGVNSLYLNSTGNYNIAQGFQSMFNNTLGSYNVAQGFTSLFSNTNGSYNVALGHKAGYRAFGFSNSNVYIGNEAGPTLQTVESNKLYIANSNGVPLIGGDFAAKTVTISGSLTSLGGITGSLLGTSSYANNALSSSYALTASYALNASGSDSASYAHYAFSASFASSSTSASYALTASYWSGSIESASYATTSSYSLNGGVTQIVAGNNITINNGGSGSVTINAASGGAVFPYTGSAIISGSLSVTGSINGLNIGLGKSTNGESNISNIAIGANTLANNTIGYYNTAIGSGSLEFNTEGVLNTSIGGEALNNNTIGVENTAVGVMALSTNTGGDFNTALGNLALFNVEGNNNTAVGHSAGVNTQGASTGNVYLGRAAGPEELTTENNKLYIANAEGTPLIGGDFAAKTVTISGSLEVKGDITGSIQSSSYALTASYAMNGGGVTKIIAGDGIQISPTNGSGSVTISTFGDPPPAFPYTGDAEITGSLSVTNGITGSLFGTSSYTVTASYALNIADQGYIFTQSTNAVTWSIQHGLKTDIPLVNIYTLDHHVTIPKEVVGVNGDVTEIYFSTPRNGYAIVSKGSGISTNAISASYALTASYAENVKNQFPYTGDAQITGSLLISSSNPSSNSMVIQNGFLVLPQVSASLNFESDAAAALGGVPLGGIYRNGEFIQIRLV